MSGARDPWCVGATVGEYVLERRLGAGGFGVVDLARHAPTGALRAIKSLPLRGDPELLLRFQREGESLARLDDAPGVVRVHATGEAHGRRYLVMQYPAGGDLEARLRRGPLPPAEVVTLGVKLARALQRAHELGVLHRDLKPANVLFSEADEPVLVDFGLARLASAEQLTASGELLGTPAYMAPEQVRGDLAALGPATDVYGLGGLLYRALTGRAPAEGATAIEVLGRVLSGPPPDAARVAPQTPPALAAALRRALARRPADRFPSAAAFAAALEASLAARPGRAVPLAVAALAAVAVAVAALVATGPDGEPPAVVVAPAPVAVPVAPPRPPVEAPRPKAEPGPPASVAALISLGPPGRSFSLREGEKLLPALGGEDSLFFAERLIQNATGAPAASEPVQGRDAEVRLAFAARSLASLTRVQNEQTGRAWLLLSELFEHGRGVARSEPEAARCLLEGARTGFALAIVKLAEERTYGHFGLAPEPEADARELRRIEADASLEMDFRDAARVALGHVADRAPDVVSFEEGARFIGNMARTGPGRVLRIRLFHRAGKIPAFELAVRHHVGSGPSFRPQAFGELAALLDRTGDEAAWHDEVHRRAALGEAIYVLVHSELLVRTGRPELVPELVRLLEPIAAKEETGGLVREARIALHRHCQSAGLPELERARALLLREPDGSFLFDGTRR